MITDAILNFLGSAFRLLISGFVNFSELAQKVSIAIDEFFSFATPILEYTLWFFNVPVLKTAIGITASFMLILVTEYAIKLAMKYFTQLF